MAAKNLPERDLLLKLFDYNPATGLLYWRPRLEANNRFNTRYAGTPSGCVSNTDGYAWVSLRKERYAAHRIIWLMVYGEEPDQIDHIDGDRANNRLYNLRNVTEAENRRNTARAKNNTSGATGVIADTRYGGWIANIKRNGKTTYLGKFNSFEDAVARRKAAEVEMGFHPNHGR